MEIRGEHYHVRYDRAASTIVFQGSLRLSPGGSVGLVRLFGEILALQPRELALDLRGLEFINSLGMSTIYRFCIELRGAGLGAGIQLRGTRSHPWQVKSLGNLRRIVPGSKVDIN